MSSFGDISHLYANNEPPAFAARFCEAFENGNERHDWDCVPKGILQSFYEVEADKVQSKWENLRI